MRECPDYEKLLHFVLQPPQEADAELAAHIYVCEECQNQLSEMIQLANLEVSPIEDIDSQRLHNFIKDTIRPVPTELWKKLTAKLSDMFESGRKLFEKPLIPKLHPVPILNARAKATGASSSSNAPIRLVFAANTDKKDPAYWEAILEIPPNATPLSYLKILVVDHKKQPITVGKLLFLGVELNINDGFALISLHDFRNNLHCPVVSYTNTAGKTTDGNLTICE